MTRYFMKFTPLFAAEVQMMTPPRHQPRRSGRIRSSFRYSADDVRCKDCTRYDSGHPCHLNECVCLEERIEALHAPLSELNRRFTLRLTERLQPRPGHSREELQLYFEAIDRAYKTLLDAFTSGGVRSVEEMVERSGRLLDLLIFGIAEQNTDAR